MADFIKLNWVIESTNQTEQRIYRKIDDNPEELLATVPVSSVEYSDTTAPGLMTTQASYRVESVGVYRGVETIKTSLTETYTVPIQSNGLAGMTSADKNLSVVALEPISLRVNGIAVETESTGSPYQYTSPSTGEARYVQLSSTDNVSPLPTVQFLSGFDTLEEWGTLGLDVVSLGPDILTVPDHIPESLTNLSMMFANSTKFNDPNVALWDVSEVTDMTDMFRAATAFNQDLSQWCVPGEVATNNFATDSSLQLIHFPVWGTCPRGEVPAVTITAPDEPYTVGNTYQLAYNYNQDPGTVTSVEWASNTGAVTVDNTGLMTAVSVGDAFVSVTINGTATNRKYVVVSA